MAKVAVFQDPLKETLSYKLSDFFDPQAIAEDTEFELWRLGSPRVMAYIGERARAEPDSMWGRWYRNELETHACRICRGEKGKKPCVGCGGSGEVNEILQMQRADLASVVAAITRRANPIRVDVSENGGPPEIELWDTNAHQSERFDLLEGFFVEMSELALMLFVRAFEAETQYTKAYAATRKNSQTSSRQRRAGGATKKKRRG